MNRNDARAEFARLSTNYGFVRLFESFQKLRMPFIRAINYHSTPAVHVESLNLQLQFFMKHFRIIGFQDLKSFLRGELHLKRPGLIICFDDGYRSNYTVVRPLLNSYQIEAFFFVIAEEAEKASNQEAETSAKISRKYMNWREINDLKNDGHIIGSHTLSHKDIGKIEGASLSREVVLSKLKIENAIGQEISCFCYPFGTRTSYSAESIHMLKENYSYIFHSCPGIIRPGDSSLSLGRNNIEADWDLALVRAVLSGIFDIKHVYRCMVYRRYLKKATKKCL